MNQVEFDIPLLPPSLNMYRNIHWGKRRKIQKLWREYVLTEWLKLKRPEYEAVHITVHFLFPDRRVRDIDNYIATGSKLIGDALKGCFIPDDSPRHLRGWSFQFSIDHQNSGTIIKLTEVKGGKDQRDHLRGRAFKDLGHIQRYPG